MFSCFIGTLRSSDVRRFHLQMFKKKEAIWMLHFCSMQRLWEHFCIWVFIAQYLYKNTPFVGSTRGSWNKVCTQQWHETNMQHILMLFFILFMFAWNWRQMNVLVACLKQKSKQTYIIAEILLSLRICANLQRMQNPDLNYCVNGICDKENSP